MDLPFRVGIELQPNSQAMRFVNLHTYKRTPFVTDLSAAGLPAELKHITPRRKRKQP
jgi:hypothetical protein